MRDAAMPGDYQQLVVRNHVAQYIDVRKNRSRHQRPGDDAFRIHRPRGKHFVATEQRFADQRTGNSVSDGVHDLLFCSVLRGQRRFRVLHTFLGDSQLYLGRGGCSHF